MKIWCPKCQWQPLPTSLWSCTCGNTWNTFDTRAICPSCAKKWEVTQCLSCGEYSPHEEWYHDDDLTNEALKLFREFLDNIKTEGTPVQPKKDES